ncbi:MAG: haloacid dehalogenase-like hydrolase, partial [Alphaproteobacteria bacterium]|nr:haloacid dehalogenase-like hydrolase [Alphaproteobacteria bacterium]
DVYLSALLEKVPYDALICTRLQAKDDVLTGLMESGNCVRQRKAELVAAYLAAHGPFAESWGYGNLPHDLPMLALVQHKIIV